MYHKQRLKCFHVKPLDIKGKQQTILDVREPDEFENGHVEEAVNIPLGSLRNRIEELPRNKEILTYCTVGQRSYYALRILQNLGFDVKNISGGIKSRENQLNKVD